MQQIFSVEGKSSVVITSEQEEHLKFIGKPLPGLTEIVERNESIIFRGLNAEAEPVELRMEGLLSRCIQHETDLGVDVADAGIIAMQ